MASIGTLGAMCIDSELPFDTSSLPIMIQSENLAKRQTFIDTSGIRGTRQHDSTRVVVGPHSVSGQIRLIPTADELNNLLQYVQGSAKNGDNFNPAEAMPSFFVLIDRVVRRFTYECVVSRATFRGSQGQPMEVILDLEAKTESVAETAFPALTFAADSPFVFSGLVGTIQSSARSLFDVEITVDNGLITDRFVNSTSRSTIPAADRNITVSVTTPYTSSELALYDQAVAGAAATFAWTNADGDVLTFTCGRLQTPAESPTIPGKDEIRLAQQGFARRVSTTNDLVIALALA